MVLPTDPAERERRQFVHARRGKIICDVVAHKPVWELLTGPLCDLVYKQILVFEPRVTLDVPSFVEQRVLKFVHISP
jgi:hypothetical protein